ncbi:MULTISPECIES: LacI family DNA-binding transcriptional regulator [unclassified Enterococcus]|uniref:LacI family DNA-binding transcriptional regulator n=1 Tax=unclassified Enterococcus TaxID=2608891 RepID=UPI00155442EE|nr:MULTISPECIES: LacI family DNA-binding transcriptional regulator [unclassified Enterococcus]MBS7576932.1 LacI family DNA-binding transcriptional regulator [Enterococcus sp. MMGLQ5-2]MBS7584339.1 LacI family DNA-binding transcriptional regulator [Enterococcus sp. MMGLQ5-1]NPD12195.1 LacI family DNA-binding transcriptional regulator [Enterococcus sp. MMGLQ5-1]NPD36767.1 LacI family DNA-binding transcriptional regulator [Enterococcus sp. MMGLQ5-2]
MENIRSIALKAGVSKSTVSRVMNGEKYVSEENRKKVKRVIEETGYIPNGNAIKLSKGKNNTIGVTLPYNNSCYDKLSNSILYQATKMDYQVLFLPTYHKLNKEKEYFSLLEKRVIDGLIITKYSKQLEELLTTKLDGKIIGTEKSNISKLSTIYPDRKKIYSHLFSEISKTGTNKVIFMTKDKPEFSKSTLDKFNSYNKYFGTPKEDVNYFTGLTEYSDGYHWAMTKISKSNVPDFIFANGDEVASGIISGLKKLGITHNKDFKIIGEGNTPYSELMKFSSIDFLPNEIGKAAFDFLLSEDMHISVAKKPLLIKRAWYN